MAENIYDVIIVGAGPSGLAAAIYTTRRSLKTLLLSKDLGGQAAMTDNIENYPGFEKTGGLELMQKFQAQAMKFGTEFLFEEVEVLNKEGEIFSLTTSKGRTVQARVVILAFGLTPKNLNVPGEKQLIGRGVAYCATCDGPLYKGKDVVVVGGGNSALDAAEFMSKIANKVYLLHRRDIFRGEQILINKVTTTANIEIIYNAESKEVKGEQKVEALVYEQEGTLKELKVDGVFVEIGHMAKTDWTAELVDLTERKEIKISRDCETKTPGLFAAGDITDISYKQAVISAGEGAKAGLQAYKFLQGANQISTPDWS
ncbi:FAD-dependent oxidoreductase [Patescibacteria group bacterium]|jgi:thioredoxin reductase (NADPH)|nr:FAD-dependent oxidoreductase [Patescibacteria group bacterium]